MLFSYLTNFFSCFALGVCLGFLIYVIPRFLLRVQNEAIDIQ